MWPPGPRTYARRMSVTRPMPMRVPPAPLLVAGAWALSTLYLFIARSQRMERPWGIVLHRPPAAAVDDRDLAVLGLATALAFLACQLPGVRCGR